MRYLVSTAKPILEDLLGTAVFYAVLMATGSVIAAASAGLAVGFAQATRHRMKREQIPGLLLMGILLTITLGGLSIATDDPRIVMMKPTIVYCCIGATMLPRRWVLRYIPRIGLDMLPGATWERAGRAWTWLMFLIAVLNAVLVSSMPPREAAEWFLAIATGSKLVLFAFQYALLRARVADEYRKSPKGSGNVRES